MVVLCFSAATPGFADMLVSTDCTAVVDKSKEIGPAVSDKIFKVFYIDI